MQVRAYMLAHGTDPDAVSEDDYRLVMVAFSDGLIGNRGVLNTMGSLTTGIFNYIRSSNAKAYSLQDVIGSAYDYIYPPLTDEQKKNAANEKLLSFISMMPGANENLKL